MIYNLKSKKEILLKFEKIFKRKSPIIISGGNTIKQLLKDYNQKIHNKKILISDERLVKTTSKLRNDIFFKTLIKKKNLRSKQIINYKLGIFDKREINSLSNKIKKIRFYCAILSLGSNGHFASIFDINQEFDSFYFINNSTKFPKNRVTVSLKKISESNKIYFIASRKNKKKEIESFRNNKFIKKIKKKKIFLFTY